LFAGKTLKLSSLRYASYGRHGKRSRTIDTSEEVSDEVFNNRAGAIYDIVKARWDKRIREQERFTTAEAANWDQAIFGRGTLNGIELVLEDFKTVNAAWKQANLPPEPFDKQNPLPEL
jgi:hypothetical protein